MIPAKAEAIQNEEIDIMDLWQAIDDCLYSVERLKSVARDTFPIADFEKINQVNNLLRDINDVVAEVTGIKDFQPI